jgi:hypothetical protein
MANQFGLSQFISNQFKFSQFLNIGKNVTYQLKTNRDYVIAISSIVKDNTVIIKNTENTLSIEKPEVLVMVKNLDKTLIVE